MESKTKVRYNRTGEGPVTSHKKVPALKNMSYPDRLQKLSLPTICFRRLRGDMIETYKLLKDTYDS